MTVRGRPRSPGIFTPREWDVFHLLRKRHTNEEIADHLGITLDGAKYHVSSILSKLGVSSRVEASQWEPAQSGSRGWGLGWLFALGKAAGVVFAASAIVGVGVLGYGVVKTEMASEPATQTADADLDQTSGLPDRERSGAPAGGARETDPAALSSDPGAQPPAGPTNPPDGPFAPGDQGGGPGPVSGNSVLFTPRPSGTQKPTAKSPGATATPCATCGATPNRPSPTLDPVPAGCEDDCAPKPTPTPAPNDDQPEAPDPTDAPAPVIVPTPTPTGTPDLPAPTEHETDQPEPSVTAEPPETPEPEETGEPGQTPVPQETPEPGDEPTHGVLDD